MKSERRGEGGGRERGEEEEEGLGKRKGNRVEKR